MKLLPTLTLRSLSLPFKALYYIQSFLLLGLHVNMYLPHARATLTVSPAYVSLTLFALQTVPPYPLLVTKTQIKFFLYGAIPHVPNISKGYFNRNRVGRATLFPCFFCLCFLFLHLLILYIFILFICVAFIGVTLVIKII